MRTAVRSRLYQTGRGGNGDGLGWAGLDGIVLGLGTSARRSVVGQRRIELVRGC